MLSTVLNHRSGFSPFPVCHPLVQPIFRMPSLLLFSSPSPSLIAPPVRPSVRPSIHPFVQEVHRGFPDARFAPTHAVVATWENVAAYEESARAARASNKVRHAQTSTHTSLTRALFFGFP